MSEEKDRKQPIIKDKQPLYYDEKAGSMIEMDKFDEIARLNAEKVAMNALSCSEETNETGWHSPNDSPGTPTHEDVKLELKRAATNLTADFEKLDVQMTVQETKMGRMNKKADSIKAIQSHSRTRDPDDAEFFKNLKKIMHAPPKYRIKVTECTKEPPYDDIPEEHWIRFKNHVLTDLCNHFEGIPEPHLLNALSTFIPSQWGNEQVARALCQIQGNLLVAKSRFAEVRSFEENIDSISNVARLDVQREWDTAKSAMQKLLTEHKPLLGEQRKLIEESLMVLKASLEETSSTHLSICKEAEHSSKRMIAQFSEVIKSFTGKSALELSKTDTASGSTAEVQDVVKDTASTKPVSAGTSGTVLNLGNVSQSAKILKIMEQHDCDEETAELMLKYST